MPARQIFRPPRGADPFVRHDTAVDAWLERAQASLLPREVLLELFDAALVAIWARTRTTLGEVTLGAIAGRVVYNAAERFPAFASLEVEPNGRIDAHGLRGEGAEMHHQKLLDGIRFVLIEFLGVIGTLSAELLSSELHLQLAAVAPDPSVGQRRKHARAAKPSPGNRS